MGHHNAAGFADAVAEGSIDLTAALHWHVRANHFPPLPVEYVEVAKAVIDHVRTEGGVEWWEDQDEEIDISVVKGCAMIPNAAHEVDGVLLCSVGSLIGCLHLDAFLWADREQGDDE